MGGLAGLRNDLRNELRYGVRFLVRDSAVGERRVRSLLANERLPPDELRAITDRLLFDTLTAAIRQIPRYRSIKSDFNAANVREVLAERFPIVDRTNFVGGSGAYFPKKAPARWTPV